MRAGADFFLTPTEPAQRRYEALRAYIVEGVSAVEAAGRFGYSVATLRQMAAELRGGRVEFFVSSKPGPRGPRKAGRVKGRVIALRGQGRSVTEIARVLDAEGVGVSAQTVWAVLEAEGYGRLARRPQTERGAPPRAVPVKARALPEWPAGQKFVSGNAGLYLLLPAIVELGLLDIVRRAGYPATSVLASWHSIGALLVAKLARRARISHVDGLAEDPGLGLFLGLTALPKATHLSSYSYRVRREANVALLSGCAGQLAALGLVTGAAGFNLDFHAIRHHGEEAPLEKNYVPRRSQATRSVMCFFAQEHASTEMVYANADTTRAEQAREVVAFADYWREVAGQDPGLLVFDSRLTTYPVLDELTARGIRWLTLRQRGKSVLGELAALPDSSWVRLRVERAGRYRAPEVYDHTVQVKGISQRVRQIAVRNIGRDEPTLLISNDHAASAKDLFARYAERMLIENRLAADIKGFHLDALSSGLALNVDLDTTLTVVAGNLYRLLARQLQRYENATPDRLYRHFIDATGTLTVSDDGVTCALAPKTYTPVLIQAGFADREIEVPWWEGRRLRFTFPPR